MERNTNEFFLEGARGQALEYDFDHDAEVDYPPDDYSESDLRKFRRRRGLPDRGED
jgi:hypothetical protein